MARTKLHCSIITPERQVLDADVDAVVFPAHDGLVGVAKNRAPLLHEVGIGVLRLSGPDGERRIFVDGGFAQVLDNDVTILTTRAMNPDEIDREAAQQALAVAEQTKITDDDSFDARQKALARAKSQLQLSQS